MGMRFHMWISGNLQKWSRLELLYVAHVKIKDPIDKLIQTQKWSRLVLSKVANIKINTPLISSSKPKNGVV